MTEKNFKTGYPFQSFESFYEFIRVKFPLTSEPRPTLSIPNIRLLWMYALLTGIKISQIALIKWQDIVMVDGENRVKVKDIFNYGKLELPITKHRIERMVKMHYRGTGEPHLTESVFKYSNGAELNPRYLSRDIRNDLKKMNFPFYKEFLPISTQIIYGRRVLKIHGYDKATLNDLKRHLNRKSVNDLMEFLCISTKEEEPQREIFEGLIFTPDYQF